VHVVHKTRCKMQDGRKYHLCYKRSCVPIQVSYALMISCDEMQCEKAAQVFDVYAAPIRFDIPLAREESKNEEEGPDNAKNRLRVLVR
jgi:hypothetical protein